MDSGKRSKDVEGGMAEGAAEPDAKRARAENDQSGVLGLALLVNRPATKAKMEWLYTTGKISPEDMSDSSLRQLTEFSDSKGVEVIEQYNDADISNVRNKAGFFGGVIKRFREKGAGQPGMPPPGMGGQW